MKDERARLRRMRMIARLREKEHRTVAAEAGAAFHSRQRQAALASRALDLATNYDLRRDALDGADLAAQRLALVRTRDLARTANVQAEHAQARLQEMALREQEARHRRDRVRDEVRAIARLSTALRARQD